MEHSHFLISHSWNSFPFLTEKMLVAAADARLSMGLYASVWNNYLGGADSVLENLSWKINSTSFE